MGALSNMENGIFAKELEDELLKYKSDSDDYSSKIDSSLVRQTYKVHRREDMEVQAAECKNSESMDTSSEHSSSFDDTDSGLENCAIPGESEVVSDFQGDASLALGSDGFGPIFGMRRRKMTPRWKDIIRPLKWRCKWVELQMKKFQSQAQKYERELAAYSEEKLLLSDNLMFEGLPTTSLPRSGNSLRAEVLKRKKRKGLEATVDVAAYMSRHNLFSYYEQRNLTAAVSASNVQWQRLDVPNEVDDSEDELGPDDESLLPTSRVGSLEQLLQKIYILQSQVRKLRSRVDKIRSEQTEKLMHTENSDALPGSPCDIAGSPNEEDTMPVGAYIASQLLSEYNMYAEHVHESGVPNQSDVISGILGSMNQTGLAGVSRNAGDDILIDNQRAKEEMDNFGQVKIQQLEKHHASRKERASAISPVLVDPDLAEDDQPPPKLRSISQLTSPSTQSQRIRDIDASQWTRRSSG